MDPEEAAAAILDVSGDAEDLRFEDEDEMASFEEELPGCHGNVSQTLVV